MGPIRRNVLRKLAWLARGMALGGFLGGISLAVASGAAASESDLGPFGPESPRMREQLWMLPSGDPGLALRATVFRPKAGAHAGRRPLVVINHGTSDATRESVSMPVFYWLSRWFVDRGYVVVLPERRGHGATGGELAEAVGNCVAPDHYRSGLIAAEDVAASVAYMRRQPFVDADNVTVVGISTGGWASLALASHNPPGVKAIINIAGGRGGHAWGRPGEICGRSQLVAAAKAFGQTARVPTLWLYSKNDSFFGPQLARAMAGAWTDAGGSADLHVLPAYGEDGHQIADDQMGWNLWGPVVESFLEERRPAALVAAHGSPAGDGRVQPASASGQELAGEAHR